MSMAASASCQRHRHHDALAGGEAIGLDHDRRALRADISQRVGGIGEAAIGAGRNIELRVHSALVKPLEPSSWAAALLGPNALMPAAVRSSTIPATSGVSGPTMTRSTLLALQKSITGGMVGDVERDAFGLVGDAGIARRAPQFGQQRRSGDLPRQSVFAAAGTEQEDVHCMARCWEPKAGRSHESPAWPQGDDRHIRLRRLG